MTNNIDNPTVIVPCEPDRAMRMAGARALDAWSDDHLRETVDGMEMAVRVWKAMSSAAASEGTES